MLKMDRLSVYSVLPRTMMVAFFGWTTFGHVFIPIVPNDVCSKATEARRLELKSRKGRAARLHEQVEKAAHIYHIPCVKHVL